MFRNASIRSRVLAVLALPVLVLVLAAVVASVSSARAAREAGQLRTVTAGAPRVIGLVDAMDAERSLSARAMSGDADAVSRLRAARAVTDRGLAPVSGALLANGVGALDAQTRAALQDVAGARARVRQLRQEVDAGVQAPDVVVRGYDAVIADQVGLPSRIADEVSDPSVADTLRAATDVERLAESLARERDTGVRALGSGAVNEDERANLLGIVADEDATRADANRLAPTSRVQLPPVSALLVQARDQAYGDVTGGNAAITADQWSAAVTADRAALAPRRAALAAASAHEVARLAGDAQRTALLVVLVAVAAVLVPVALALLLARGITVPLRRLTAAAADVRERLPSLVEQAHAAGDDDPDGAGGADLAPIPVRSKDEVGRLAAAFNDVNATSVRVAREQAALRASIASTFVNVARRDQALLSRQLAFIDTLERTEEDPKTLQDLFTLDHLATRMRRNAESLLVLAGIESGRRLRAPMPLSDVVRTASSEIEDYQRVDLSLGADPLVLGHLALPAAHMLAELLENATTFSDPATRVRVSTAPGPGGAVLVTVADDGLGMSGAELDEVRSRIADPTATAAVGASKLGSFVVGRIARRLGAEVTLQPGPVRGTVVKVWLPATAFVGASTGAPPARTPAGPAAAGASPALRAERRPGAGPAARPVVPGPAPVAAMAPAAAAAAGRTAAGATAVGRTAAGATAAGATAAGATTAAGLPRRGTGRAAPSTPPSTAAPAAAPVPAALAAWSVTPALAPASSPEDVAAAVTARSAVFTSFRPRRGQLEPAAPASVPEDQLASRRALSEVTAASLAAGRVTDEPVYAPRATQAMTALPTRASVRAARGEHRPPPRRGLLGRLGQRTPGVGATAGGAPAAGATAAPPTVPVATAPPRDVQPMTRRELRALEATGRFSAARPPAPAPVPGPAHRPAPESASAPPSVPVPVPEPVVVLPETPVVPTPAPAPAALTAPTALPAPTVPTARARTGGDVPGTLRERSAQTAHALRALGDDRGGYRPVEVKAAPAASLARRRPAPGATTGPVLVTPPSGATSPSGPRRREAAEVRSMLSGFQSGVARARRTPDDGALGDGAPGDGAPPAPAPPTPRRSPTTTPEDPR